MSSPFGVEADKAKHRFARRNAFAYRRKAGARSGVRVRDSLAYQRTDLSY